MIRLLAEYCRREKLAPEPGFGPKYLRWAICCGADGRYTGMVPLCEVGAKRGQEFIRCPEISRVDAFAGGVTRSSFLADRAEVVLLLSKEPSDPKLIKKHDFFLDMLRQASSALPDLGAAADLLSSPASLADIRADCAKQKVKPGDVVTLCIEGELPLNGDGWHDWWRKYRLGFSTQNSKTASARKVAGGPLQHCFVTGELALPERIHLPIIGLGDVGGNRMGGDVLIGFDKEAFNSFGFERGRNAPVSRDGAVAYRAGLNKLLETSVRAGNSRVAFWFKDRVDDAENPLLALLGARSQGDDLAARQRAIDFLRSIHTGRVRPLEGNRYYALTLSGAGGRVMVRDWMEGSFESLASAIADWFADLQITTLDGDSCAPPPSLGHLSDDCLSLRSQRATDRKQTDDERRRLSQPLFRAALTGVRLSDVLPLRILAYLRSELPSMERQHENDPLRANRFAVLRAYLVRYFRKGGDLSMCNAITPALNPDLPSVAYHCGRVLAILAALQKRALGAVGAGVIQRYYASASTNPGLVFGRLIKSAQYHIDKLGPDKSGYLESLLAQTMTCVSPKGFPQVLSLQEQGLFGLGYYHQIADLRKKRAVTDDPDTPQEETASDEPANQEPL
jgi:CRISPR-associated protein Csd1